MSGGERFRPDPSEPLGLWVGGGRAPASHPQLRARAFELSSRGARVPGRLLLPPEGSGPFPLVLLQHGAGGSKQAPYIEATAGPWATRGLAVASIDFPLHGERADAKLSAQLARGWSGGGGADPRRRALMREVAEQAVLDLRRTLDALLTLPEIDAERVAYAGFSLGALLGAVFCAVDPRPRAAALALGGAGLGPPDTEAAIDPADWIGRIAPRPVLLVNATRDAIVPRAAAEALFEAAREPRQLLWFEGTHDELPGAALKAMWSFLSGQLGAQPGG
jgi:dienelactone hydrolase